MGTKARSYSKQCRNGGVVATSSSEHMYTYSTRRSLVMAAPQHWKLYHPLSLLDLARRAGHGCRLCEYLKDCMPFQSMHPCLAINTWLSSYCRPLERRGIALFFNCVLCNESTETTPNVLLACCVKPVRFDINCFSRDRHLRNLAIR